MILSLVNVQKMCSKNSCNYFAIHIIFFLLSNSLNFKELKYNSKKYCRIISFKETNLILLTWSFKNQYKVNFLIPNDISISLPLSRSALFQSHVMTYWPILTKQRLLVVVTEDFFTRLIANPLTVLFNSYRSFSLFFPVKIHFSRID